MKEEIVEELLQPSNQPYIENKDFQKQLHKKINRSVYGKTLRAIMIIVLLCVGSYFPISMFVTMDNYNPFLGKNNAILDSKTIDQVGESYYFHILMEAYTSIHLPGYYYYNNGQEDTRDGFSKYTMHYYLMNGFEPVVLGTAQKGTIQYSKWNPDPNDPPRIAMQFISKEMKDSVLSYEYNKEEMMQEISKMPESSQLDMSISFEEPMKIEDFLNYKKGFSDVTFAYMASYIHDSLITLGFSDRALTDLGYYERFKGEYPNLTSFEETKAEYENRYTSLLKLMIDNGDFFKTVNSAYFQHGGGVQLLQEEYDRVKDKGLFIRGIRVYASKEEAIQLLQNENILYTWINDAKFSQYQR